MVSDAAARSRFALVGGQDVAASLHQQIGRRQQRVVLHGGGGVSQKPGGAPGSTAQVDHGARRHGGQRRDGFDHRTKPTMPRHERGRQTTVGKPVTTEAPPAPAGVEYGKSFASTNVLVATGTLLSRITGLLRILAVAAVLGQGNLSDSYNVANNLPNIVYELLVGGALTATLVPLLVKLLEENDDDGISAVSTVIIFSTFVVAVVATVGVPVIAFVTASPYLRSTVRDFAYFLIPEIFFYGITTLGTSLLNARRKFIWAAFVPVLNNVTVMVVLVAATSRFVLHENFSAGRPSAAAVAFIGLGTTAGIVMMSLALVPPLRDCFLRYHWRLQWGNPAVKAVGRLAPWAVGYVITNQIAYVIVTRLAQRQVGGVSAYNYASTFFLLPHGLLAVSLITTFTPNLASLARRGRWRSYTGTLSFGMRVLVFLVAPAAGVDGGAVPSRRASLLERGKFGPADAALTGRTLTALVIGLVGFSLYFFALRSFYAVQDARTPFYVNTVENAINIVLAIILVGRFGVVGLAVSYAAAYVVSAILTLILIRERFPSFALNEVLWWLVKVTAGAAWCALVTWQVARHVGSNDPLRGSMTRIVIAGSAGAITFLIVMMALAALDRRTPRRPGATFTVLASRTRSSRCTTTVGEPSGRSSLRRPIMPANSA